MQHGSRMNGVSLPLPLVTVYCGYIALIAFNKPSLA